MLPPPQPVAVAVAKPAEDEPTCDEIVEDRSKAAQGLIKRYRRGKLLGKGGFAKCYELISMDSGRTYAGKVVPKSTLQKSSAKKKVYEHLVALVLAQRLPLICSPRMHMT